MLVSSANKIGTDISYKLRHIRCITDVPKFVRDISVPI